jgi:hypothetical protein
MLFGRSHAEGLIVCASCGADFVSPIEWEEHDATNWWMLLRCGECGAFREAVVSDEVANRYDRELHRSSQAIVATLERLDRERMTAEVETFATALRLDLLDAGDFGAARER